MPNTVPSSGEALWKLVFGCLSYSQAFLSLSVSVLSLHGLPFSLCGPGRAMLVKPMSSEPTVIGI